MDKIKQPDHYTWIPGIEARQVVAHFSCFAGQAMQYIWRHNHKGNPIQDLEKARECLRMEIERLKLSQPKPCKESNLEKLLVELDWKRLRVGDRVRFLEGPIRKYGVQTVVNKDNPLYMSECAIELSEWGWVPNNTWETEPWEKVN